MWLTSLIAVAAVLIAYRLGWLAAVTGSRPVVAAARPAVPADLARALSPAALRGEVQRIVTGEGWDRLEVGREVAGGAAELGDRELAARLRELQRALGARDRAAGRFGSGSASTRFYQSGLLSITEALEG